MARKQQPKELRQLVARLVTEERYQEAYDHLVKGRWVPDGSGHQDHYPAGLTLLAEVDWSHHIIQSTTGRYWAWELSRYTSSAVSSATKSVIGDIPGVVEVSMGLYVKSTEARDALLEALEAFGYKIENCSQDEGRPPLDAQQQRGWTWYRWYASLGEPALQHVWKCGKCSSEMSSVVTRPREAHCESCGQDTIPKFTKVFGGEEYGEFDRLPVPTGFSIYEALHWMPLQPYPRLHEVIIGAVNMIADCGWYIRDGRQMFFESHLRGMRLFVEHFTTLDLEGWDQMITRASLSGPGMIQAVAAFCHDEALVTDKPNIFAVVNLLGKASSRQQVSAEEEAAAKAAIADPGERAILDDLYLKGR